MKPSRPGRASGDFFRDRLDAIIDMRHPLVRLAGLIPWSDFEVRFGKFYKPLGRRAKRRSLSNPYRCAYRGGAESELDRYRL